jgi:hypothetical protein
MTDLTTATRCGVGVREHLSSNSIARFMAEYARKKREKQDRRILQFPVRFDIAIIPEYFGALYFLRLRDSIDPFTVSWSLPGGGESTAGRKSVVGPRSSFDLRLARR